jgi:hypothetical protein
VVPLEAIQRILAAVVVGGTTSATTVYILYMSILSLLMRDALLQLGSLGLWRYPRARYTAVCTGQRTNLRHAHVVQQLVVSQRLQRRVQVAAHVCGHLRVQWPRWEAAGEQRGYLQLVHHGLG